MKTVAVQLDELTVTCHVLETRQVFGRTDLRVTPVAGSGEKWVQESSTEEVPDVPGS